jgi:hypothetical protein
MTKEEKKEFDNKVVYSSFTPTGIRVVRNVGTYNGKKYDSIKIKNVPIIKTDSGNYKAEIKFTPELKKMLNEAFDSVVEESA